MLALRTATRAAVPLRSQLAPTGCVVARALHTRTVDEWISDMTSKPPTLETDFIDTRRAEQMIRTLPSRSMSAAGGSASTEGAQLPKGHHLIYFQPKQWMEELAKDGTSTEYNAPPPYDRRMWAGGKFQWAKGRSIKLGAPLTAATSVGSATVKKDLMFVQQIKEYFDSEADAAKSDGKEGGDWIVREERNHVFLQTENAKNKKRPEPDASKMPTPAYSFTYTPTSPLLFRYSALTWNGHKIHYDKVWCREVEGHPDLVVHGPMTANLLIELAERAAGDAGLLLKEFQYRATSPMYVDKPISLAAAWDGPRGKKLDLWATQSGYIGMKATAYFDQP